MRVLSRLFRRLFLEGLADLHAAGRLAFLGHLARLSEKSAFDAALAPLRRSQWVVYAKRPFAGPQAVLAYLARYTHRVAISNSRLIALDEKGVTFRWKDYRIKGRDRLKTMTLDAHEFIRRFLLHVLPTGFHRIRHYGLFASTVRARNIERVRQVLAAAQNAPQPSPAEADSQADDLSPARRCPCCGGRMIIVETFEGARPARQRPPSRIRIDTSGPSPRRPPSNVFDRIRSRPRPRPRPRWPHKVDRLRSRAVFALVPHIRAIQDARHRPADQRHPRPQASSSDAAPSPRPSNPHSVALLPEPHPSRGFLLARLSNAGPRRLAQRRARGRRPKPFSKAVTSVSRPIGY